MPGNFSQRHTILSVLRPKISPFLHPRFVDLAYGLPPSCYTGSSLHREIIEHTNPNLLALFDQPARSDRSLQDWHERFTSTTGDAIAVALAQALPACDDVLDVDATMELLEQNRRKPSRAIYHLLRVLSFALARAMISGVQKLPDSWGHPVELQIPEGAAARQTSPVPTDSPPAPCQATESASATGDTELGQ